MKYKMRIVAMAMLAFAAATAFATPGVKIDSVLQRYPWANTVDIRYTVSGAEAGQTYDVVFTYKVGDGAALAATNATVAANGSYVAQWTPTAGTRSADCTMFAKMTPISTVNAYDYRYGDYMIVDLVTGAIKYESDDPAATESKYNTDEYKTTKMVLRKVSAARGVCLQKNTSKSFTFDHDYYIGIFEVTEAQYKTLVPSGGTSSGDTYPVANVSWEAIRGSSTNFNEIAGVDYAQTSNTSFFSRLNKRVSSYGSQGVNMAKFDLPTEAAWEYAAGAGTSGTQTNFFGNLYTDNGGLDVYAWHSGNAGGARHPVGGKKANQWGLFDVYGNVVEWCRDRLIDQTFAHEMPSNAFTAASSGTADNRAFRGGSYNNTASGANCTSHKRNWAGFGTVDPKYGFRVAWDVTDRSYMIVDLKTGAIKYEAEGSTNYNTREYKTSKMVFRKIPAGTYSVQDGATNAVMASEYYIGIFEVTEGQYRLMDSSGAYSASIAGMTKPTNVTWQILRGTTAVPERFAGNLTSGPIFLLKSIVKDAGGNVVFDLPTEAMWEVAARAMPAGDSSHAEWAWFFVDKPLSDYSTSAVKNLIDTYAWCSANTQRSAANDVGSKSPNAWGIYDIYGNSAEWCLDGRGTATWSQIPSAASDRNRRYRGGSWSKALSVGNNASARNCSSSYRSDTYTEYNTSRYGFRLAAMVIAE